MLNSLITLLWMGSPDTWFKLSHFKLFFFIFISYMCVYMCVQSVKYSYRLFCWPLTIPSRKTCVCLKKNKKQLKIFWKYIIWWRQGVLYEEDHLTFFLCFSRQWIHCKAFHMKCRISFIHKFMVYLSCWFHKKI